VAWLSGHVGLCSFNSLYKLYKLGDSPGLLQVLPQPQLNLESQPGEDLAYPGLTGQARPGGLLQAFRLPL
jgi:hypothetical protein